MSYNEQYTDKRRSLLVAGLGSIGRRHFQNLKALGCTDIILYRTERSTLPENELAGFPVEHDLEAAFDHHPLAVIVSNPTALHLPVALSAAQHGCHLFLEKPISHTMEGVKELLQEIERRRLWVLVGFQFRFHPALRQIKKWLDSGAIGKVVSAHVHWGEHLPNWHPWEDFRRSYSARSDLGGGVLLTLCHPFDYLRWLLGTVTFVSAITGRLGGLEIEVEDTAQVTLRFVSGALGNVYLDYVERPSAHWLHIVGQKGTIRWNGADGAADLYRVEIEGWESFAPPKGFERNTMFLEEMRHFLNCLSGKEEPLCTLQDGIHALKMALAAKRSAAERREVDA
jgi:predicted dehydrogenase